MRREIANIKDHYEKELCKKFLEEWRKVEIKSKERKGKGERGKRKRVK